MIITLAVGGLLLAGMWSLLSMYSRLFDAGKTKAGNTQLITGLTQQLADDLRGAVSDVTPGLSGSTNRFGLFGDSHSLQIDVMQTVWPPNPPPEAEQVNDSPDAPLVRQAHELRTVRYTFVDPDVVEESGGTLRPGLTRREFDFESPYATSTTPGDTPQEPPVPPDASDADLPEETPPRELYLLDPLPLDVKDSLVTLVPEIIRVEFRYFDGITWSTTWNSVEQKALPAAVEMVFDFRYREAPPQNDATTDGSQPAPAKKSDSSTSSDNSTTSDTSAAATDANGAPILPPGVMTRRLVFELPASQLRVPLAPPPGAAAAAGPGLPPPKSDDSAGSLLDMAADNPDQDVVLMPGSDDSDPAGRSRFRFSRRSSQRAADSQTVATPTAQDQWIRVGP